MIQQKRLLGEWGKFKRCDDPRGETRSKRGNYFVAECLCNQDYLMAPLLENRIPFEASIHYGHETVYYNGGDYYLLFQNFGAQYSMMSMRSESKRDIMAELNSQKPVQRLSRAKYLKDNADCIKPLED